jgi:ABC-2 type transport system ATP-binding protein
VSGAGEAGRTRAGGPAHAFAIETDGLRKSYGRRAAVADLTVRVPRGEVFAFLGPNGAGKSTAVKMLLGLVRPDAGSARLLGRPPSDAAVRARVGFLPEHFRFHEWLRADEFLDLHARLYGMDRDLRRRRIAALLERVGLSESARKPLSAFSKGMLQRVGLAQALLPEPELLFLDEPTSALDPFGRILVREVIRDLRAAGTTVFLNSHLLSEVEATADRACFIREGVVLRTVGLRELEAELVQVEARFAGGGPGLLEDLRRLGREVRVAASAGRTAGAGGAIPDAAPEAAETLVVELSLPSEDLLPAVAERIVASGARLYALSPRRLSLEELFVEIVGRDEGR